jgi:hypothetical protein
MLLANSRQKHVRAIFIWIETSNRETAGNGEDMLLQTKAWHRLREFRETWHPTP